MTWLRHALGVLLLCTAQVAGAQESFVLGVQTHFGVGPGLTDPEKFRAWMAKAGLQSSRDEMYWNHVEDDEGRLSIARGAAFTDSSWASMPASFSPLLILSYGHHRYDSGGQPRSPEAVGAFARYAGFVVRAGARSVPWVEIWNEWNGKAGARHEGGSDGAPLDYVHLVQAVAPAVKAASPSTRVLVGAMSQDFPDWSWTRQAVAGGLLGRADGLSVHLYNHCPGWSRKVGADEMMARLDALRAILVNTGWARMPIHVTEIGWPTHEGRCGVTEGDAAAHTVRFLLEAGQRAWLQGVWLYEFMDGGDNARDQEHRFGLLRRDGSEKPAGCAVRVLGPYLNRRAAALERIGPVALARYAGERADLVAVWAKGGEQGHVRVLTTGDAPAALDVYKVCDLPQGAVRLSADARSASVQLRGGMAFLQVPPGSPVRLELLR